MVEIQLTFLMKIKDFILTIVQRLIRNNPNCHQNLNTWFESILVEFKDLVFSKFN